MIVDGGEKNIIGRDVRARPPRPRLGVKARQQKFLATGSQKPMPKRKIPRVFATFGIFSRDNFNPQSQCRFGVNAQQLEDDFFRSRARHPALGRDAERGSHL
jgi:hypothetical protein